ncbi:MAG TPA: hydrogenase maturation nickel metallochaperone HypA [Pirellulales bacterium]|nr:hydrogenase maturation nickel metallochaperone HypA [Pirellulales bacterium]
MHEHSLVQALLAQVERLTDAQGPCEVEEVHVRMGPFSGVEPLLVESAFEALVAGTSLGKARLVIEEVPLSARCAVCGHHFEVLRFQFRCPACDTREIEVTGGDGFMLESITLRQVTTTGISA